MRTSARFVACLVLNVVSLFVITVVVLFASMPLMAQTPQTINFTQPTTPQVYSAGMTIPLVATGGGSGNPVVFSIDGASSGAGSIAGSTLSVTGAGTLIVDANQAGNGIYSAAPQVQREINVAISGGQLTLSVNSLAFNNAIFGELSPTVQVNVKNASAGSVTLNGIVVTPSPYSIAGTSTCSAGSILAANATCSIMMQVANPTMLGVMPDGALTVNSTANNAVVSIPLSGSVIAPTGSKFPTLAFYNVPVGTVSVARPVTVMNYQLKPLAITSVFVPANYSISSNACGGTLAARANCLIYLTVKPTAVGPVPAGSLTINTDAPISPLAVPLTATGVAPTGTQFPSVSFYNVPVGTVSVARPANLINYQLTPLTITSVTVPANYSISSNQCGSTLAASSSCLIYLTVKPTALGPVPAGNLTINTDAPISPLTVPLTATGIAPTGTQFPTLAFYDVPVGTVSVARSVKVINYEKTPLTITSVTAPANYSISSNQCGSTLAASSNCLIYLTVKPTALGPVPAENLTINTDAPISPLTVPLTATGVAPTGTQFPTLAFYNVPVGTVSVARPVTVINYEPTPLTITSVTAPANYSISNNQCGSTLAANSNCLIYLTVKPTALGPVAAGNLTINTDAAISPLTVPLTATGIAPTGTQFPSVAFYNVPVGTVSVARPVNLINYEPTPLTITSVTVPANYSVSNNQCGSTVAASSSCLIYLTVTPTALGPVPAGNLTINTDAAISPLTVPLTATGIAPTAALPTTVNFGNVAVGTTSALKAVKVYNYMLTPLTVNSLSVTAGTPYAIDPSSTCLTPSVAAGGFCTVNLTVTPMSLGAQAAGTLTIATTSPNSPLTVALSSSGQIATVLTPTSVAFGNLAVGSVSATKTLTIQNNSTNSLALTQAIFNGPFALDTTSVIGNECPLAGGTLSGSIAAGASCVFGVTFDPTTSGATSGGKVTVIDTDPGGPVSAALSGSGANSTTLSPASVAFGNVIVGGSSAVKSVTFTNNQTTPLSFSSITAPAPFAVTTGTNSCVVATPVAANSSCAIYLTFSPTSLGAAPASSLTVQDNATSGPTSLSTTLTGTGVAPVTLSVGTLAFGNVVLNQLATKSFTLTNNQATPLSIASVTGFSGGYALDSASTTCPIGAGSVPAAPTGNTCVIAVDLTATTTGSQPGSISINDNAPGTPQSVALSGNALAGVLLSPGSLSFATQFVGNTSAAKSVTLTNEQNVPLQITSANITGADPSEFGVTTTCPTAPSTLNAAPTGNTCALNVTFTPIASGTRTATLSVTDSAPGSPQTITLTGSGGTPVVVSPTTITTFTAPVGTTSAFQTITITNEQLTTPLHLSSLHLSGDFIQSATTCPLSPAALGGAGAVASCTVSIEFDPSIGGTRNGQLQIVDDDSTSPQVINLSGAGTSPLTISPGALAFSAQTVGTLSAAKAIILTNHEVQQETFALTAVGSLAAADYSANSNCPTGVIAANSSCTIFVLFSPTSATTPTRPGTLTITTSAAVGSPIVASLTGSATTTPPAPAVSVVSPGAGAAGAVVNVVITGNGWTHFSNASAITFPDSDGTTSAPIASDIAVSNIVAVNANTIDATLILTDPSTVVYGARDVIVSTPLTAGGTETAQLLQAFIIENPNNQHQITSVVPAFGTQGQTLNVALTGSGTNWQSGVTYPNFGDGITVDQFVVNSATSASATITISNTTYVGYRTITLITGGEFDVSVLSAQSNPIFQIGANSAALQSVSPNVEPQGWPSVQPGPTPGQVTLTAIGSHFLQNATQVTIGGAIVGDVNVISPTQAVAQVVVPTTAPLGPENVSVSTGGEIFGLANAFTITGSTPALVSVSPSSAAQGAASVNVVITGNQYLNFANCSTLNANFTGEVVTNSTTVTSQSPNPNQVTANISVQQIANAGTITASLTCGATLYQFGFTITPSSASIISVVPNAVPQGGQVQLSVTGLNTNWVQGTTTASFYPVPIGTPSVPEVTINSPTSATLNVAVPTNTPVGSYGFYMATGGQVESASINVYANTPTLTMNPANGLVPTAPAVNQFTVNFTGQFTKWNGTTLPVIAGEGVTLSGFTVLTPVSATATVTIVAGAATGPRLVTFTTGGEIETTYLNVTSTPVGIISINPFHSAANVNNLNVAIVGLNTHFQSGAPTTVLFGPQITVNSVLVVDDTHLTANISTNYLLNGTLAATPPGYQTVYVNDANEQVLTGFGIDAPGTPTIVSVVPNSAQQGSDSNPVTITGNNLTNWQQGVSELILGAGVNVGNLVITSPNTATATISVSPTAPIGGNSVIMITGSEVESGAGFSVTPGGAYIASVEPNFTCPTTYTNNVAGFNCSPGSSPTGVPVVAQLQTLTLNVVGIGTHWLQGGTTFTFGTNVNVDQTTITSPTTATLQITVLSSAAVGFTSLTGYTDGETAYLQQAIDVEEGSPALLAFTPSGSQQATTFNLQLLGRFTHWAQGVTSALFNQDIAVNSITVQDSEDMTVNVTVSPWAYVDYSSPCGHVITVTTGNEQVAMAYPNPGTFCVSQGAEQINSVSPLSGIQGSTETLTVVGSETNFVAGETTVSFGDLQIGEVNVVDSTHLTVPIGISTTSSTGLKQITVSTLGQVATQQYSFTVTPGVATLNEAIPNQAEQGSPLAGQTNPLVIRLLGQYSHFNSQSTATFGAGITVQGVQFISATEVDATITIDPLSYVGGRLVTVDTPNVPCSDQPPVTYSVTGVSYPGCTPGSSAGIGHEIVTANIFTIIQGPAIIQSISPNTGNEGQEVVSTITGSGTHWAQNFTQFYIAGGGSDMTINSVVINSPTSATVDMTISQTANAGARSIYMVTNGESLTDSGAFVVTGGVPAVSYITPGSALMGTSGLQVTVVGNAYTQWAAGTTVNFGPGITVNSFQVDDASHIEAVLSIDPAAQVGYRTVVVLTGTQGLTGNFLVTAPAPPPTPFIWYESPSSAIPGQTLQVNFTGYYTQWNPGPGEACSQSGTTLTGFGSGSVTVNCFQVTSPTTAYAYITVSPTATAQTFDLTLTTTGTTNTPSTEVDNAQFSIVVAQPTLSVVDPGSGIQGATGLDVNILGQFTAFDNTTTFNFGSGITVNSVKVLGPTIAIANINIGIETPTGGYAVTANTPDATAANQVSVSGAGFSVTPSLALIASISPNTSEQGTQICVVMTGQNTHWGGNTVFSFGAGITVTSATVTSATTANVCLAIPPLASEGPTGATATTSGEVARISNGFVVQAGTPLLLSSGPGSLPQQSSAVFTILSQATDWSSANPPVVTYGNGVVLTNINVTGPTSMTVEGFVQPTTNVGYRNLTVTAGTQVLNLYNAFYVTAGPAVINSVSPNAGGQGVNLPAVQINGINTNWQQGVTTLNFPYGVVNSLTVTSPTSMTANVTIGDGAPAGQVTLTATTLGEVANGVNVFTITQTQPELLAVVSGNGVQGATETVTVTGAFTHFSSSSVANFGAGVTVNSVNALSTTQLQVNITVQPTANVGLRNVTVTTGAEVVTLNNSFTVTTGPAAILSLNPSSGGQGNSFAVAVVGSQSHFAAGVTTTSFSGGATVTSVTVTDLLHATVNITIPNNTTLGQYNVYLYTGGETAAILPGFTVTSGTPQISAVNSPTGPQGSVNMNVQLTGLYTSWVSGTSVANFGAGITVNSTTCSSSTACVANITISTTAALGSRNITVTTGAQVASITGGFTVLAGIPALVQATPAFAQAGQSGVNVVVTSQFTLFQQGFTSANFGSGVTVNFITVNSTTQLTANISVASNATVGSRDITITTSGNQQTLPSGFAVTAGTPVITQISPNYGNPGQSGLAVTVYGQYTNWVNGTTIANFGPSITVLTTVVNSPTQLVATITIPSGTAVGPETVTTTTGAEIESVAGGFTVQAATVPAPTLLSISPGPNAGGVPINSNFTFVFSQPMNRTTLTTSSVEFWLVSNPSGGWVSVPGTVTVDASGRVATFTPSGLLAVNAQYYLLLTNAIQDATGNTFPQYGYQSFYTQYTANTAPVTVVAVNPPANATGIGTNVTVQLEFSANMNQETQTGLTVSTGGSPVAGTYSWNSYPYGNPYWGPGTILTFTPSSPLTANTTYTVTYTNALADTAGNSLTPGSFSFTTGSGADTAYNSSGSDFSNGMTNVATNFAPRMNYSKPVNPIDINTGTLLLYNADSGKYIQGTVTVAPSGMSAQFTPTFPLLPDTYYRLYQAGGYYDADGNYMYGVNDYFTTGVSTDTTQPTVVSVSPANSATAVPLNSEVIVHFSTPIDPDSVSGVVALMPTGGGAAVSGTSSLQSDLVTLIFTPTLSAGSFEGTLQPGTEYTIQVNGFQDLAGNPGVLFSSTFTTAASFAPVNVSTGLNSAGALITANNTNDGHWVYYPTAGTPSESTFGSPSLGTAQPLQTVGSGDSGFYGGWPANGPSSDWIAINPNSTTGNTYGLYYTTFALPNPLPSGHLCLVGSMGVDDNGLLAVNGTAIMGNVSAIGSLTAINVDITSYAAAGTNVLSLGWGSTDNSDEAFRLQAVVETCGASNSGGLTLSSASPAYATTGNATNTTVTLTFNNALDPATVNATTLPVMVGFNSNQEIAGTYAVNGSQVVFTPSAPFPTNTQIWVGACNGPLDLSGDSAGSSCYTQLTYFTTGATAVSAGTPFQILASTPTNGSTNIGLRAPVAFTANRSFNFNSVNSTDFAMFAGDGQSPWCNSWSHSQDDATILFTCYPMPSSDTMTAMLSSGLTDWQGNGLQPLTTQFTTSAYDNNTNGTVVGTRPGNTASGIATNEPLTLYFSLPINASTASSGIQVAQNNVAVPGSVSVVDNGYTLVFTPSSNWTPGALIQWWTLGSLLDTTYDTPINTTSGYFFVAADPSTATPTVQVFSPGNGTYVGTNGSVDLQFNTPLNPSTVNSTNIYLYDTSTGLHIAGTYSMPQSNEVRIVPTSPMGASRTIYVYVTTAVQSATSVPVASQVTDYFYTNAAMDTTVPVVVSAVPFSGAGNVGTNVAPGFVFSKPIDAVSVNSTTFTVTNGGTPLAGNYYLNSSNTRVQFVPYAALPPSTTLVMTLNGVLDLVGNPISYNSSFTTGPTPDFAAPYVVSTSLTSGGSIPTNSTVSVQFSESMDVTTFSTGANGDIYLYDTLLATRVPATLTWNASQTVAYLTPTGPLSAGRTYYFYVNSGTDLAGNQIGGIEITVYAEFTPASTSPTVVAFNPLSGATGLGTNVIIEAEFSAPIDPTTLSNVTLSQGGSTVATTPVMSAGNTVVQLVPNAPLLANTTYVMNIVGVKDPAGNALATATNTFTTGATFDNTPATATVASPANNSTVGTNVVLKYIFSKPINPITVNNSTFRMYLYDSGQQIPLTVSESSNGLEVTMVPQIPLLPSTRYYFQACCGYQDQDGNNGTQATTYFWTNGGAVTTGPTVFVNPANAATGIPLNAQVIAMISAPVDATTVGQSAISVTDAGNNPVAGVVTEVNNQQLNFAPGSNLLANSTYTVKVNNFTDADGNAVVPSTTTFTTGTAALTGGLTLTGAITSNAGGALSAYNLQICLTFSQLLDPSTVNATTLEVMNGWNSNYGLAGSYQVGGSCGTNAVGNNTVVFTPANPYPAGATIYVGECGGPTDILGDVFQNGSCWTQQLISFATPSGSASDTSALTVLSVSPAGGAANVRPDTPVSVTFNKAINPYSVYNNGNNALLFAGQSLEDRGSITMSADDRTLTFNSGTLYQGTTYTIDLPAGGISDPSGNALANTYTSTFAVGTNPATGNGTVQGTTPGNNATDISTASDLTLYMNRQVNAGTVSGQLTVTVNGAVYAGAVNTVADGYEIEYVPSTPFPNGATVQWFLSGSVLDVNGDSFNANSGYFYTVGAAPDTTTAQPALVTYSPAYGASNVPINTEIELLFSQPLNAATINSTNVYVLDNSNATYPAMTMSLLDGGQLLRLVPNAPLNPTQTYYVCANANVQGANGVATAGNCWLTYFYANSTTTADTTPGTVVIGPPNGSVNVGTNAYLRFQFSKPVDRTSVNATNIQVTTGGNPIQGGFTYSYTGNDVTGVNFYPTNPLPASSAIAVTATGLLDYVGNTFTSANSTFTTAPYPDYTTPSVTLDFGGNTNGIATNATFTCRYSEPMDPSSVNASNTYVYSYVNSANIPVTYAWSSDLMSLTMTPVSPLFANSEYNYYCSGAIDLTGNGQSGGSSYFYTGNGTAAAGPVLLGANPPSGATGVALNTNAGPWYSSSLQLLFNEAVASDSMSTITLTPNGGSAMPIAVYPENGNTIAVVQLPYSLQPNTQYTFNTANVTDLNGNLASGTTTSSFTTGADFDWSGPSVASTIPVSAATGVAVNTPITVTFSELMDPVLIDSNHVYLRSHNSGTTVPTTFTITVSGGATTVNLTPTTALAASTIYDIVVSNPNWCMTDVAGNNINNCGLQSWSFTTGTATAANGICGTANGASFSSAPTANLCSAGTATLVTNPGSWTWSCTGQYSGTTAACSATVTGTPACASPTGLGLAGLWPGTDNATDFSGNGNNGTLVNGAGYALGVVGDGFNLEGNSGNLDEYVLVGATVPASLQIQDAITLSAWIYPTQLPTNYGSGALGLIVGSQHDGTTSGATIFFDGGTNNQGINGIPPGHIQFQIGNGSWHEYDTTTQLPLNQWTQITATRSANGAAQIYYNGVLQPSVTNESAWDGTITYTGSWFAIGQQSDYNRPFVGLINDAQIYSSSLTQAQVSTTYAAGAGGVCQQ